MDFTYAKLTVVKTAELTAKPIYATPANVSSSSYTMTSKRWGELRKQLDKIRIKDNDEPLKIAPKSMMERTHLSHIKTQKWVQTEKASKEASMLKECTFKPNINHSFAISNEYPRSCHFDEMQRYIEDRRAKEWSECMSGVNGKNNAKYKNQFKF